MIIDRGAESTAKTDNDGMLVEGSVRDLASSSSSADIEIDLSEHGITQQDMQDTIFGSEEGKFLDPQLKALLRGRERE